MAVVAAGQQVKVGQMWSYLLTPIIRPGADMGESVISGSWGRELQRSGCSVWYATILRGWRSRARCGVSALDRGCSLAQYRVGLTLK